MSTHPTTDIQTPARTAHNAYTIRCVDRLLPESSATQHSIQFFSSSVIFAR
jgi:hypothetical protein